MDTSWNWLGSCDVNRQYWKRRTTRSSECSHSDSKNNPYLTKCRSALSLESKATVLTNCQESPSVASEIFWTVKWLRHMLPSDFVPRRAFHGVHTQYGTGDIKYGNCVIFCYECHNTIGVYVIDESLRVEGRFALTIAPSGTWVRLCADYWHTTPCIDNCFEKINVFKCAILNIWKYQNQIYKNPLLWTRIVDFMM